VPSPVAVVVLVPIGVAPHRLARLTTNPALSVVGVAGTTERAVELVRAHRPEAVLVLSPAPSPGDVAFAREPPDGLGAVPVLLLPDPTHLSELLVALTTARPPSLAPTPPSSIRLAPRQLAVLRLAAEGRRASDIAGALGISVKMVEHHLGAVRRKLGARSTAQAVARAQHLALLGPTHATTP
jgi:DNA-binding CsgD family transcriptional regulator